MTQERNHLADSLAAYIFSLMEGDTHMIGTPSDPDSMYGLLFEHGYCDEDGEPIYEDEE